MSARVLTATAPPGLSDEEARARLATYGPNRVESDHSVHVWRRVAAQLVDPLILVLLAAIVLTLSTGDTTDALIIALVVVINSAVGVVQELRADRAIAALAALSSPVALVRRDGVARVAPADELVPGDVVLLAEGDIVPADGHVVEAVRLLVDESAMTGEADAIEKASDSEAAATVSAGTVVVRGRGTMVVSATGAASALGRIAALVAPRPPRTPLQRRLAQLGRWLALAAAAFALVVFVVGVVRGQDAELMAVAAISLVVAAVPESLPAVVTLALALGARRMARNNAIIRRLPAVETLGSVTVVATDKTGTLTQGRMAVARLWTPDRGHSLAARSTGPAESALLRAAALCNDARLTQTTEDPDSWPGVGDPTETALLRAAAGAGWHRDVLDEDSPRVAERPFESGRRSMTTIHAESSGLRVVTKGAPEVLLTLPQLADEAGVVDRARAEATALTGEGYRVLAIADAVLPGRWDADAADEARLRLLGLVALVDPVRDTAADTFRAFSEAGIRPVLITGDDPGTATAAARRAGLGLRPGAGLYARATPADKLDIIRAMQQRGDIVAMTGDGVNDAPALRQADIGVAMGQRGTEVARQAADLVLADDELSTLVAAVQEGRRAYDNVRRFLLFGLAGGAAEVAVMVLGPAFGIALPLLPAQILWINLLTHGLPGVAMGAEPSDPDALHRPPRPTREPVLGAGLWQRILVTAAVTSAITLAVGVSARAADANSQTSMFLALGMLQFGAAAGVRAQLFTRANLLLPLAIAVSFLLMVAGTYAPPLQDLLSTQAVPGIQFASLSALSVVTFAVTRATRRRHS